MRIFRNDWCVMAARSGPCDRLIIARERNESPSPFGHQRSIALSPSHRSPGEKGYANVIAITLSRTRPTACRAIPTAGRLGAGRRGPDGYSACRGIRENSMQVLSRQRGVSLIEVLVAMLIFSIGVLGIALMQIKGSQFSKQAGGRTVAVLQARSLADAMRANLAGVYGVDNKDLIPSKNGDLSDSYYVYSGPAVPTSVGCDNAACRQAHSDLAQWITQLKAAAPTPVKADGSQDGSALAAITVDSDKG